MRSLRIKNFKCFEDKTIDFTNLTVLAGGNGAGKSTVIQTFLLLAQSIDEKDLENIPRILYLNDYYCNLGSSDRLLHYGADNDIIEFEFTDKHGSSVKLTMSQDQNDLNILNIEDILDTRSPSSTTGALSFVEYFDFIGADRFGPKSFHHTDSNFSRINVGKLGEYTALILHNHKFKTLGLGKGSLIVNVNSWLCKIFGYVDIDTTFIKEANIAMLKVKNHPLLDNHESPVNMPYGVSYLLPIIVSCLVRQIPKDRLFDDYEPTEEENEMVIIENPEAHLHPAAQSKLGYFLAKMSNHVQIIIETHSEHIINGIRLATLEDDVDQGEITINFFESNEDKIEPNINCIKIDIMSDLTDWPRGFFDQQAMDVGELFKSRAERYVSK
ncbi:AAA family ATPase [Sulfurimonas sp.]|uniref:AAA family ATPase n=1 Tax=Sulfurimonas sp. TaxID=2022749 RepID=UPI0035617700